MEKIKQWLRLAVAPLEIAITVIGGIDDNDTGIDDDIAKFLAFVVKGIRAILSDDEAALTNVKAEYANDIIQLPVELTK